MPQDDKKIAEIARRLAEALQDVAYTRNDSDRKNMAAVQTELCQAVREEKDSAKNPV